MGVDVPGGWEAARLFCRIDLADLGRVEYRDFPLTESLSVAGVEVYVDNVDLACVSSQIAGLRLGHGDFAAIGSGPARALAANSPESEDPISRLSSYRDSCTSAVLGIQATVCPDEALADRCARLCSVRPEDLYLLVHPSTSIVGAVQVSARIIEQTVNKMIRVGFDLGTVVSARGFCAIAPPCGDELEAMGRINDCLLYGGKSFFEVHGKDDNIASLIGRLVTESSPDCGRLFKDLFLEAGKDFHKMDLDIHSPACVQIYNIDTGRVFSAGGIRTDMLVQSFFTA
jgi:methenyltetrahydromethanopterin cyclohydrolase